METLRIFSTALILLLIVSSTAFGQRPRKERSFGCEARREFKANQLNLTEEQKTKVAELRDARFGANKERRESLASLRQQRQELMSENAPNLKRVNEIVDRMSDLRAEIEKENIKFHHDFRALLSDEQKEHLKSMERRIEQKKVIRQRARFRN